MAPFEPKTDSKEFEVALREQVGTSSPGATTSGADLTVRLWRQDRAVNSTPLTWNSENVLVYMIADLIAASYGRLASELPSAMTAHFEKASQALVAAKRIQLAILEFVSCSTGDCLGAAILIHPPVATGFSAGMTQNALRLSEPGQIILSETVSRVARDIPGTELRPVAALTTGGTEHSGLSELVWASAEQIAKLRESARAGSTRANAAPQVGATMIVNAPLMSAPVESDRRESENAGLAPTPLPDRLAPSREGVFEEGLADFQERRSFITKTRLVVGAVALVVIGAAVVLFYPQSGSKLPTKPPDTQTVEAQPTPAASPEPASPSPPSTVQPIPNPTPSISVRKAPKPPAPKDQVSEKEAAKKAVDTPIQGFEGISTYDGMTQRDIPRLLQWARSDAGNGRYEKAGQEYRVILQLQPNNPDAKEGLRKLQLAQGHDQ